MAHIAHLVDQRDILLMRPFVGLKGYPDLLPAFLQEIFYYLRYIRRSSNFEPGTPNLGTAGQE